MTTINPPVLVYHASARSIVFRDHVRRSMKLQDSNLSNIDSDDDSIHEVEVTPLPRLEFGKHDEFEPLLHCSQMKESMTEDEYMALRVVMESKAVVKTIKYDCR